MGEPVRRYLPEDFRHYADCAWVYDPEHYDCLCAERAEQERIDFQIDMERER